MKPNCCPPLSVFNFDLINDQIPGNDYYYFKLHGLEKQPYWYGDNWLTALSAELLSTLDLSGGVVFVSNCWLLDSPMLDALKLTNPVAIVGGHGENYASKNKLDGSDLLGYYLRILLMAGMRVKTAFDFAMKMLETREKHTNQKRRKKAMQDALQFKLLRRDDHYV